MIQCDLYTPIVLLEQYRMINILFSSEAHTHPTATCQTTSSTPPPAILPPPPGETEHVTA